MKRPTPGPHQRTDVYAPGGRLLATYDSSAQASPGYHYNLTDWLGTKRMQTTANGNQQETCTSNPFGDGLSCTGGADATEQHFTGKDHDTESGLDYFYARYYSETLGRFMTPDWAAAPAAVPYVDYGDPQSLNLYAYVQNNPLTGIDAGGHDAAWNPIWTGHPYPNQPEATMVTSSGWENLSGEPITLQQIPDPTLPPAASGAQQQSGTAQGYWVYDQKTGELSYVSSTGKITEVGTGYSGRGKGLNNPKDQNLPDVGPIPQGKWHIGPQQNNVTSQGVRLPGSMRLTPLPGTNTFDRAGFLMHGDNRSFKHTASNGCIIMAPSIRNQVGRSPDRTLVVIP